MKPSIALSRLALIFGSIFVLSACETEPASENERTMKTVREHQAKEKKSFNNPEPVTGFEHTVTFNLMGTKLVIPYGYLARYSKDNRWFSDTPGQDSYFDNFVTVSVHYRKTNQGWVIEPYNRNNREHFIQALKDGLDSMDDIVIKKSTCHLNREMGKWLLDWGFKKIPSDYPEYEAYEEKTSIPENPYIHEIRYVKKGGNPAIITHWNNRIKQNDEDNYSTSVGSCINGFTVEYYPFTREKQQLTQQEVIGYHRQVEQLLQSFLNNPSK